MEIEARDRRPRPDGVNVDYPLGPPPWRSASWTRAEITSTRAAIRQPIATTCSRRPAIVPRSCQSPRDRSNRRALALRGIDGWRKIATVPRQHTTLAAALALALLTAPLAAGAQPPGKVYLIGILADRAADANEILAWQTFRAGLREQGWKEGVNIRIESRWIERNVARCTEIAADLLRLKPDLIATRGSFFTGALKAATSSIPIVFLGHADPVGTGHVASLARPGGNITGMAVLQTEIGPKCLELLHAAVPAATRVAVLWHAGSPASIPG